MSKYALRTLEAALQHRSSRWMLLEVYETCEAWIEDPDIIVIDRPSGNIFTAVQLNI